MYRCSREGKQWQPQRRSQTTHLSTMQPGPKRLRVVCPLCNGPHALDTSATRQVWCPCAPGDGPLGPTPRGPFTSSTYIPSTPPNSMINSGGLLSGTDALDRRCCCGLLQAAAGCCGLLLVPLLVLLLLSFVFQDSSGAYVAATGLVGSGFHPS